jgi:replicative DNA helicase
MRRRAHIEFLNYSNIKVTNFAHQKIFDIISLHKEDLQIDLISVKAIKRSDSSFFKLEIDEKNGVVFNLMVIAETRKNVYEAIKRFNIYNGKEQTIEVDLPS